MMKRLITVLGVALSMLTPCMAQNQVQTITTVQKVTSSTKPKSTKTTRHKRHRLSIFKAKPDEQREIGRSTMAVMYDYTWNEDTTNDASRQSDRMILQIGPEMSRFTSHTNLRVDSLLAASTENDILSNPEKFLRGVEMSVYKHLPERRLTLTDRIAYDLFAYEEPFPEFNWELTDSTREILGYRCSQAHCHFRGRHFTAWFAEDIPVDNGPWKFGGLPGLILSVADSEGHYTFECVGIYPDRPEAITEPVTKVTRTDRKKFYETLHRYDTNPYSYAETVCGVSVTVRDAEGNIDAEAYKPQDLYFDYIERDINLKK